VPKRVAAELSPELYRHLNGTDIASMEGKALLLCTAGADGWPHPAMLSYFEVAARDLRNVRVAVYGDSRTTANMRERKRATLLVIDTRLSCYIKGTVQELAPAMRTAPYNAVLNLQVEHVLFDEPSAELEPGVYVTAGVTYTPRTGDALRQARAVLAELLE
jgi:hypothetical protein